MRFVDLAVAVATIGLSGGAGAGEPAASSEEGRSVHAAERVRATVEEHIRNAAAESGGLYRLRDERTGRTLDLELVRASIVSTSALWKVHDPRHRDEGQAFFACTLFHLAGGPPEKRYDVDVRVEPRGGELVVTDVRIHKETQLVAGKWIWEERAPSLPADGR